MPSALASRRSNLPADVSSFVGRRRETTQVLAALTSHRLVTLLGPGGVGKTRLSQRCAADRRLELADGAWFIELAPLTDPGLIPDAILGAIGARDVSAGEPLERLLHYLEDRELLLVLDNCEHVLDAVAEMTAQVLARCPQVRVLATSRHQFNIAGEQVLAISPLEVPAADRSGSPLGLLQYDAVRLFVDRASASLPGFEVDEQNQAAVAELVRRLDGIPLALELAAVRVRVLTPMQILERLTDRFALLTRGDTSALPRQQTLRALIDWSYDLLDLREREVWAKCSVFGGSFDLEAAEAVCAGPDLPTSAILDVLDGLVTKSILVRIPVESDGARYRLLGSLQEYGAARLEASAEAAGTRLTHAEYFYALASQAATAMFGPHEVLWFRRLVSNHENFRAALEFAVNQPDYQDRAIRAAAHLQHYWVMSGRFGEARTLLCALLDVASEELLAYPIGLVVVGRLSVVMSDVSGGLSALDQAAEFADGLDATWIGHSEHARGIAALFWGDPTSAVGHLEAAAQAHQEGEDPYGYPLALVQLATARAALGDVVTSADLARRCATHADQAKAPWCAGLAHWVLALGAWSQEDYRAARNQAAQTLELKEPFGDVLGMAMAIEVLAWTEAVQGDVARAVTLLSGVAAAMHSVGADLFRTLRAGHDRAVELGRAALSAQEYAAAWAAGTDIDFGATIALALRRTRQLNQSASVAGAPGLSGTPSNPQAVKLTKREVEIAVLVGQGLTSREIGERLFISGRTAEGHVDRILRKLGARSRVEVAAWVAENLRQP